MVTRLLDISLRQRMLVVIFAIMLGIGGLYSFRTLPIDAFPDVTSVLVQVVTKAPGLSPAEVERLVTYPIELQLTGVPALMEMRSLTKVGLSLVGHQPRAPARARASDRSKRTAPSWHRTDARAEQHGVG